MSEELKPVRCGCGGEPGYYDDRWHGCCGIQCMKCGIDMSNCESEEEAIRKWNTAMGATDNNVGDKERTAKVYWNGLHNCCSICSRPIETTAMTRCAYCGARLEWE